jgi:hypothetical protein
MKTYKQGSKLAATNLNFTIPADTAYADCPFTKATPMRLIGTVFLPRRTHDYLGESVTLWEGWRHAELRSESDSYQARLYFFFPGNAYARETHSPSPLLGAEVGGCHYRAILRSH